MTDEPLIRNVSDTALWTAAFRAHETERRNPLFRDPLAARLAGDRGYEIHDSVKFGAKHTWSWVTRTYLFDKFIENELRNGADTVVNLAAGLDTRPYRMDVDPSVQWIEVDLPGILDYKEQMLMKERPKCTVRRIRMDLADRDARRALFAEIGAKASKAIVVAEGLLVYLSFAQTGELASDLSAQRSFRRWIIDIMSPGLLRMLQKKMSEELVAAGASLQFGPADGPHFFERYGWKPVEAPSMMHSAAALKRLPRLMRLFAFIPPPKDARPGNRPWSAVCLLQNTGA